MTTLIKTQCPSCETSFSLPQAQLNGPSAKARCGRCQHVFLVNKYLIDADNVSSSIANDTIPHTPTKSSSPDVISASEDNFLIYDDMPINDVQDTSTAYDSSEDIDAWISQLEAPAGSDLKEPKIHNERVKKNPQHNSIEKTERIKDSTIKTASTSKAYDTSPTKNAENLSKSNINPSLTNNIHAVDNNNSHTSGDSSNAWLEKMLEDQETATDPAQPNSNLSTLLTSMGIPINDKSTLNQKLASDVQERLYPVQSRAQTSAASVLWAVGCLVLVMLLFAQYVIFNVDNLVKNPAYAARLQAVCTIAACSLPSADISAFSIDNLQHRSSQIQTAGGFSDVEASLGNQTMQSQLFPSLKVSIYGNNAVIGEFIASPEEYLLSPETLLSAGQNKLFMFTVPIADAQISKITINPIY